jgi:hypothetical protein
MAIESNKFDLLYGKLLSLNFSPEQAKLLGKNLYTISLELDISLDKIVRSISSQGIRFDQEIYASLNNSRTNSSQIGYVDSSFIPANIRQQAV